MRRVIGGEGTALMVGKREAMTVTADKAKYVSSGNCAFTAPDVFTQDDTTGIVTVFDAHPGEDQWRAVRLAEELCPVLAIRISQTSGDVP
jgi:ferredoxin